MAFDATEFVAAEQLLKDFDAVVVAAGSEVPRDLPVPGREPRASMPPLSS